MLLPDLAHSVLMRDVAAGAHGASLQAEQAGLPADPHIVHAAVPAHAARFSQLCPAPPAGGRLQTIIQISISHAAPPINRWTARTWAYLPAAAS